MGNNHAGPDPVLQLQNIDVGRTVSVAELNEQLDPEERAHLVLCFDRLSDRGVSNSIV